jgi:acetolactate synthase I/II/III large subunit
MDRLIATACAPPQGPVYIELTGGRIRSRAPARTGSAVAIARSTPVVPGDAIAAAEAVLRGSRRPVVIAGLQAAEPGAAAALRRLAKAWSCPVLSTYMAKGAFPDTDPLAVGPFIAGAAEDALVRSADAILLFGGDPIEFLPQPWSYQAPAIMLTTHAFERRFAGWAAMLVGDLADSAGLLAGAVAPGGWSAAEIAGSRESMRAAARSGWPTKGIAPCALVEAVAVAAPKGARVAVDAGAHMLPVMALWQAEEPRGVLISRGLATMAARCPLRSAPASRSRIAPLSPSLVMAG